MATRRLGLADRPAAIVPSSPLADLATNSEPLPEAPAPVPQEAPVAAAPREEMHAEAPRETPSLTIARKRERRPAPAEEPATEELIKCTYYLSQAEIDILDEVWMKRRKEGRRRQLDNNKSALVREAIRGFHGRR